MNVKSNGFSCCRFPVNSPNDQAGTCLSVLHSSGACSNSDSNSINPIRTLSRLSALGSYSFKNHRNSALVRPASKVRHIHRTLRLLFAFVYLLPAPSSNNDRRKCYRHESKRFRLCDRGIWRRSFYRFARNPTPGRVSPYPQQRMLVFS
jgi:hypothetical protein